MIYCSSSLKTIVHDLNSTAAKRFIYGAFIDRLLRQINVTMYQFRVEMFVNTH